MITSFFDKKAYNKPVSWLKTRKRHVTETSASTKCAGWFGLIAGDRRG